MNHRWTRRSVLRGLLGGGLVSIGLPFLESIARPRRAMAAPDLFPKRFGMFFWGNGVLPELWRPKKAGDTFDAWDLSETLAPLAPHKKKLSVVSGLKVPIPNAVPHLSGPIGFFSGSKPLPSDPSAFAAATLDQQIADKIGGDSRFRSLEVGVQPGITGLSYSGPGALNPAETSPAALFQRVFGPEFVPPGSTPKENPTLALRKSVLDAVTAETASLQTVLGVSDRARLDEHLTGIRALELRIKKLQETPPAILGCKPPAPPKDDYPSVGGRPPMSEISRVMADLTAMAVACDQTRVFSFWFSQPVNNTLFPGATSGHHQLTHDEPSPQPQVAAILLQIMAEFSYLIGALDAIPEGEGTVLDHCALLGTTDCNLGRQHTLDQYPIVIAGSGNGTLRTGVHYDGQAKSQSTSYAALTLARAMGLDDLPSWGDDKVNTEISALRLA
ncbi:MAG: DUF1552 domain-containing protein [Myxococcales bacterium]|nr:DUF1552 domain-containing protein [Myxococcales bacterium]